jgi:hypothetical protein
MSEGALDDEHRLGFLRHRGRLRSGSDGAAVGAPSGSGGGFFGDGDRAAGVFGVLTTGFSILIGSVIAVMAALLHGRAAAAPPWA